MLTAKRELFVQNIIKGMSQADAYRNAFTCNNMSDKTIHEAASRLMSDSKVLARVNELRAQIDTRAVMSAQERLEWLTNLITDDEQDVNAKLKAIDIMNKMQGEYVQKIDGNIGIKKLEDLL